VTDCWSQVSSQTHEWVIYCNRAATELQQSCNRAATCFLLKLMSGCPSSWVHLNPLWPVCCSSVAALLQLCCSCAAALLQLESVVAVVVNSTQDKELVELLVVLNSTPGGPQVTHVVAYCSSVAAWGCSHAATCVVACCSSVVPWGPPGVVWTGGKIDSKEVLVWIRECKKWLKKTYFCLWHTF